MLEQRIEEVNKANHAFYAAFGNLDIGEMDMIWAHQDYVTCIHPGWSLRSGWPSVRELKLTTTSTGSSHTALKNE